MMDEDHAIRAERARERAVLAARSAHEDYVDETVAYTHYEWDCPRCGFSHETEYDPSGGVYSCDDCDARIRVRETL